MLLGLLLETATLAALMAGASYVEGNVKAVHAQSEWEQFILAVDKAIGPVNINGVPTSEEWSHVPSSKYSLSHYGPDPTPYKGSWAQLRVQYDSENLYLLSLFTGKPHYGDQCGFGIRNNATNPRGNMNDYAVYFTLDKDLQLAKTSSDWLPKPPFFDDIKGEYTYSKSFISNSSTMNFEVAIPLKTLSAGLSKDPTQVELLGSVRDVINITDPAHISQWERIDGLWPWNAYVTRKNGLLIFPTPIPFFNILNIAGASGLALSLTRFISGKLPKRKKDARFRNNARCCCCSTTKS